MAVTHSTANGNATESAANRQDAQESAVGISVFVKQDVPGFRCVVKQRFTDFLVNEVLPNGEVLHLTKDLISPAKKRKRVAEDDASQKKPRTEEVGQGTIHEAKAAQGDGVNGSVHGRNASKPSSAELSATADAAKAQAVASISDENKASLRSVFGENTTSAIISLYASVVAHPDRKARDHVAVKSEPLAEKSKRTEAHLCIRRVFQSKLETLTVQDQENQSGPGTIISIKAAPPRSASNHQENRNRNEDGQRSRIDWSELGGEYLHFTLYKENKDTMEVLYFLASQMKLHIKHFSFAGTKDRRGVTVQRIAIHRVLRQRIEPLNRTARGWRLGGPWEYRPHALELGMLCGNEFLLTLRDAHFDGEASDWDMDRRLKHGKAVAEAAAQAMAQSGYLNYYGLQRFGTHSNGTHTIGLKMLKGDLKGAVDAILFYEDSLVEENQDPEALKKVPRDDVARATAIHGFRKNGNSNEALLILPNRFSAERGIITHQGKRDRKTGRRPNENDFQGALMAIQRNLRLMYVHAYQSFVWNTVAGKRWEVFGDRVVEGDLVVVGEKEEHQNGTAKVDEVDEDGEPIIHPSDSAAAGTTDDAPSAGAGDDPFVRARPLSKSEAESGQYSIFDIVLPLPGFDVLYPSNEMGDFYKTFMASDEGGNLDPHNMRRAWKDISLSGGYRKVMSRPLGKVEVDLRAYGDVDEQMVHTDLERLEHDGTEVSQTAGASTTEKDKVAVILKFQLASSQYATMALRELTKGGATSYRPDFSAANR